MRKLLTVVIPAYNTERFLRNCLDLLLACKSAEWTELLVVDDGSTDRSGQIAEEYAKQYPDIVNVIHKENGGHGSAINTGMRLASGTYFKVVDSDDAVDSVAYEVFLKKLKHLETQHCDLIATPFACVWHKKTGRKKMGQCRIRQQERKIEGADAFRHGEMLPFETAANKLHVRMHEWTVRTALLKEHDIRLTEHSFYVDMQYILFPVPWIKTVCILDETVYLYRLGEETQSVSVRNMQKNRGQHQKVMRSLIEFYRSREAAGDNAKVLSYLARGIAKMEANQVQIALSLPIGKAAKKELRECEQEIKEQCPAAYRANEKRSISFLRYSNYMIYPLAALAWRIIKR